MEETPSLIRRVWRLFSRTPAVPGPRGPRAALASSALHAFIVTILLWSAFYFIAVVPFFVQRKIAGSALGLVLVAVSLISLFLLHRGRVRAAGWVLLLTSAAMVAVVAVFGAGMRGAAVVICPPLIVGAGWVLGQRVALLASGVFVALALTLAVMDSRGMLPHYFPMPPIVNWSIVVLASGLVVVPLLRVAAAMTRLSDALQESEGRLRIIVEAAPDAIFIVSAEGQVVEANQAASHMLGYSREELLKLHLTDFVGAEFKTRAAERLAQLRAGGFPPRHPPAESDFYESRHVRQDGTSIPVEVHARHIVYAGRPAVLEIVRDIGERARGEEQRLNLERELQRAHRLETVGRLAGGVAHDFNNLLTVIDGYGALISKLAAPGSQSHTYARQIRTAGGLAANLTRQLLSFSRQEPVEFQSVDLNRVIEDTGGMLRQLVGENVEVILRLDPAAGTIWGHPVQLQQVLVNLAANARDAMPQGGQMAVETATAQIGEAADAAFPDAPAGRYVQLSVIDTGTGMDTETQRQIFEPFFTTKESGQGTGLGLATVYGIVQRCGGRIAVRSEAGQGATFRMLFPCETTVSTTAADPPAELLDARPARHPAGGAASAGQAPSILLVEDRDDVRALIAGILQVEGYCVIECGRGEEALQLVQTRTDPVDLLLTDISMPGINGLELAERLRERQPETRVLFASGYPDEVLAARGMRSVGAAFLAKPFTADTLTAKVREVLAAPAKSEAREL